MRLKPGAVTLGILTAIAAGCASDDVPSRPVDKGSFGGGAGHPSSIAGATTTGGAVSENGGVSSAGASSSSAGQSGAAIATTAGAAGVTGERAGSAGILARVDQLRLAEFWQERLARPSRSGPAPEG